MGDEYEEEFEEEEEEIIEVPVFHKKVAHNLSSYVTEFNEGQTNGEEIQTQTSPPQTPTTPTPTPTPTPAPQPQLFKPAGWTPKRVQSFQASSTTPVQQPIITTTTTTTTTPTPPNVSAPVKRPSEKKEKKESKKSLDSSGNIKEKTKKSSSRSSVMPNNNDQLKNEVERLRNLVNILSTKIENFEREIQSNSIQKASTPSPSETKEKEKEKDKDKDEGNAVLSSILQQGLTSDPSTVLDLIENDKAIYHSGWMSKKGRKVRNWKKRWFVLKGNKLSYFNKEGEKNALGEINLETCMIDELKEREESGRPCMALLVEGRKLFFCADTPEENRRWYLYLVCKNSELTYLRKLKHLGKQADNSVLSFLEHPMVKEIRLDFKELTIDSVVSLVGPLRIHETLTVVSLKHCAVDDLCLSTLCEAIKTNISIENLELDDNLITSEGAKHLSKVLSANPVLKSISLRGNKLKDEGIIEISKVLATGCHPRLVELNLDRNDIGQSGAIEFANALARMPRFPVIALSDNHIGDQGAEAIIRLCSMNNSVTTLKLENNGIGFNGVAAIANYLRENNSVTHLYLSSNNFEQSSVRLLTQSLMSNSSLQYAEFASYKLDSSNLCALRLLCDCQFFG